MALDLDITDYRRVYTLLQAQTGLSVADNRTHDIAQVIDRIVTTHQLTGINSLLLLLGQNPITHPAWQTLIQAVTIGETYFFRNEPQLNALKLHVLPALIGERRKAGHKLLRIWSAGCATGEEPYSLAILLRELLPDIDTWNITILGTDINAASLERARAGIYRSSSFRSETPSTVIERWFTPAQQGYVLDRLIRDMVLFSPLNLIADDYPSIETGTLNMDIVICRNVTIYFDKTMAEKIAKRFYRALVPNGWLIVGHAEPLETTYKDYAVRNFEKTIFYQKEVMRQEPPPPISTPLIEKNSWVPAKQERAPVAVTPPPVRSSERKPVTKKDEDFWARAKESADREAWEEALSWLAQAEAENCFLPQIYYLKALVQLHLSDMDAAFQSLRKAIYCEPSFALAHYTLGDLYEQRKEYKMATHHWQRAQAAIAPMNPTSYLPFADELTVEMLDGLLSHRLGKLSGLHTGK